MTAEFELGDGRTVFVPSWIYSTAEQVRLIEGFNLKVMQVVHVPRSALTGSRLSPKLLVDGGRDVDVLSGYLVEKGIE